MKILNIISQKPYATGSGVYLSEIMREFSKKGIKQALIAGFNNKEEYNEYKKKVDFKTYPIIFNTKRLPFDIIGMSDTMPYPSRKFSSINHLENNLYERELIDTAKKAIDDFRPELIICHHLYFLTALIANNFSDQNICAISHGTCIRQLKSIDFLNQFIIENIPKIPTVYALQDVQKNDIKQIFGIDDDKIKIIGNGYNPDIFYKSNIEELKNKYSYDTIKLVYSGKISKSKGIFSLIKAIDKIDDRLELNLIGGSGDREEFDEILNLAKKSKHKIIFHGHHNQEYLATFYKKCDLFVFPSLYEGLGLSIIEALATGLPVVVSNTDGLQNWIKSKLENPPIIFVDLPYSDIPEQISETDFVKYENDFAEAIKKQIHNIRNNKINTNFDMQKFSWEEIADTIINDSNKNKISKCSLKFK